MLFIPAIEIVNVTSDIRGIAIYKTIIRSFTNCLLETLAFEFYIFMRNYLA